MGFRFSTAMGWYTLRCIAFLDLRHDGSRPSDRVLSLPNSEMACHSRHRIQNFSPEARLPAYSSTDSPVTAAANFNAPSFVWAISNHTMV